MNDQGRNKLRVHLHVKGQVQGVFFRASTVEEAVRLGLAGWVRNRADGAVEIVAEGPHEQIHALVEWCRRGPPRARVHDVAVEQEDYLGEFEDFRIRR